MEKITFINNLSLILKHNKKKNIFFLIFILLLNVFFETFSIVLIIPFLKSITDANFFNIVYNYKTNNVYICTISKNTCLIPLYFYLNTSH